MRRIYMTATIAGVAALVAGYFALGAAGKDQPAQARIVAAAKPDVQVELPPLPKDSSAKAVQPVAGEPTAAAESGTAPDPGLSDAGDAPTRAASKAVQGKY